MSKRKRRTLLVSLLLFVLIILGSFFSFYSNDQSLFAAKKRYKCKICDWPSHCRLKNAADCSWEEFTEGDTDVESKCCPGTKQEIR